MPEPENSFLTLDGSDHAAEPHPHQYAIKQPTSSATILFLDVDDESVKTRRNIVQSVEWQNKDGEGSGSRERPLKLLDLPVDILKDIVKEVSRISQALPSINRSYL